MPPPYLASNLTNHYILRHERRSRDRGARRLTRAGTVT